jgi:uncharacterized membrane protein YgcG
MTPTPTHNALPPFDPDHDDDPLRQPWKPGCGILILALLVILAILLFLCLDRAAADTGLTFAPGTPTSWRPSGQSTLNLAHSPFDPATGALVGSRFDSRWACRFTGCDVPATYATPRCGAEWEPHASGALRAWCEAGRPTTPDAGLPSGSALLPLRSSGCVATDAEVVGLIYHPECFAFITEWVWARAGDPAGKTPEQPLAVCRRDWSWVYAAEPHVQYPATWVYFRNTCRPEGEISYAPARRQRDAAGREFGPRIPAYPQVFGPPRAAGSGSGGQGQGGSGQGQGGGGTGSGGSSGGSGSGSGSGGVNPAPADPPNVSINFSVALRPTASSPPPPTCNPVAPTRPTLALSAPWAYEPSSRSTGDTALRLLVWTEVCKP